MLLQKLPDPFPSYADRVTDLPQRITRPPHLSDLQTVAFPDRMFSHLSSLEPFCCDKDFHDFGKL
jgi:hypothetical protein